MAIKEIRKNPTFIRFVQANQRYDTPWFGNVHVSYLEVQGSASHVKFVYRAFLDFCEAHSPTSVQVGVSRFRVQSSLP